MDWEFEFSRCRLLHIEWINSKVLLYSTGNYIQHSVINHNRKWYEKEYMYIHIYIYIYIYIWLNHYAVHLKLIQYCKSTILQFKKLKERENRKVVATGRGEADRNRERLVKGDKLLIIRWMKSEHLMYNMVAIVDNTVLYWYNWNMLRG